MTYVAKGDLVTLTGTQISAKLQTYIGDAPITKIHVFQLEMSTKSLANLLYSILQYNTQQNKLETLQLDSLKLTESAEFSNIYAQMDNVSYLQIDFLDGSDD